MQPKVKCLLVDDLEENLLALSALMRRDDVELLLARSGGEALELLLQHEVALALLDVQMPDMDGFQLAELMRGSERTRHVPIIFVTAGARDQHRLFKGYDSGAVDFLYKPIEAHILRNKADVFFQLYLQKQQLAHDLHERTETLRLNEMFTAVLGHDLRNPLSAVLAATYLLRRSADPLVLKTAAQIESSGLRMQRMIEDLLDLARVRLGNGIAIQREPHDLEALVVRVVQEHQAAFPQRRVDIVRHGDLLGELDPERFAQAVSNLIGNALHHGTPEGAIEVRLDGTRAEVLGVTISNPGRIPPGLLSSLFDPFRSGRHHTSRSGGLGLGLYIVQQIVLGHGGRIDVQSGADGITRFLIEVPRYGVAQL
jgi:two-component system sensor histidine kinase/response regulator